MDELNLAEYYGLFDSALKERYGDTFSLGCRAIETRFDEVRKGRPLIVDDVLAIFDKSLPYVHDWTKPDRESLEERMVDQNVATLIRDLGMNYDRRLVSKILYCFRELTLTALVLQHLYPDNYSICSHHIGSLLYITGHNAAGTVPDYYLAYCQELNLWGRRFNLTVAQTQFALWTWYRFAHYGRMDKNTSRGSVVTLG